MFHADPLEDADDAEDCAEPPPAPGDGGKMRPAVDQGESGQDGFDRVTPDVGIVAMAADPGEDKEDAHGEHVGDVVAEPGGAFHACGVPSRASSTAAVR